MPISSHGYPTPDSAGLTPAQLARARSHTYQLLGRLFREGLTAELLPMVAAVPELAPVCPRPYAADQAAADHQALFAFNVFPHASFFLDDNGLVGGPVAYTLARVYRQAGFVADAGAEPDHLGLQLEYLAFLTGAEAAAWPRRRGPSVEGAPPPAASWQMHQRHFLASGLLPWLTPCAVAIILHGHPFYAELARLLLALVADHHADLTTAAARPLSVINPAPPLPDPSQGSLRDIARHLTMPARSGLLLSRADIGMLGRASGVPRGFGRREQMLLNLLRAAAQYDGLAGLLAALDGVTVRWQAAYQMVAADYPALAAMNVAWEARLGRTRRLLDQMVTAVAAAEPPPPA